MWRRYLSYNSEFLWLAGREIFGRRRPESTVDLDVE
jgi:hypothetical protein